MTPSRSYSSLETRIRPNQSWFSINWREIVQYRDLLILLVRRDFVAKYKQTILGPAWFIVNPLITTLIFVLVFNRVIGVPTDGVPPMLFYLAGMLGWTYFSTTLAATSNSLAGNTHLFSKVYFPRLIPPLAVTISSLLALVIQLLTFAAFYAQHLLTNEVVTIRPPNVYWLAYPLIVLHMAVLALGAGLILSSISAKYRDLHHIQGFLINLWMYATPIIYPLSKIPERWRWISEINPLTAIVEITRRIFLGVGTVTPSSYLLSVLISLGVFAIGLFSYQRAARTFVDTV